MRETSQAPPLRRHLAFSTVAKGVILFVAVGQICQAIKKVRTT